MKFFGLLLFAMLVVGGFLPPAYFLLMLLVWPLYVVIRFFCLGD